MSPILQLTPTSPALRPFVDKLWYFTGDMPHARERILPTGTMQLLVNLHEDELRTYGGEDFARVQRMRGAAICRSRSAQTIKMSSCDSR